MNKALVLFGLSLLMASGTVQASTTVLSTQELEELGSVALANGDTLQVIGDQNHRIMDPARIQFSDGYLKLSNVKLNSSGLLLTSGFPLTVQSGQELLLENVWIEEEQDAITCAGGILSIINTTIAATNKGLQITDPASVVSIQNSNFCVSAKAIEHLAGSVEISNCLFLTTTEAVSSQSSPELTISDCSFQGNERAIVLHGEAPLSVSHCDFYGSRFWYIDNAMGGAVTLQNCYLDAATPTSSGAVVIMNPALQPWVAKQNPLLGQEPEPGGEMIIIDMVPIGTESGLPYKYSKIVAELSSDPYNFTGATVVTSYAGQLMIPIGTTSIYTRAVAYIGEW